MKQTQLFDLTRKNVIENLNGYLKSDQLKNMDSLITPESLNGNQGILGCIELARKELL